MLFAQYFPQFSGCSFEIDVGLASRVMALRPQRQDVMFISRTWNTGMRILRYVRNIGNNEKHDETQRKRKLYKKNNFNERLIETSH